MWQKICVDETFSDKVRVCNCPWNIPFWKGKLGEKITVSAEKKYCVIAVDGSQIYPDRHYGTSCFLINTGIVLLNYSGVGKPVKLQTIPDVFLLEQKIGEQSSSPNDRVDCIRQELEFSAGLKAASDFEMGTHQKVVLFDGSLIFWYLDAYGVEVKNHFLSRYMRVLDSFYEQKTLMASYISMPRSKELVNLIKLGLCNFEHDKYNASCSVEHVSDSTIISMHFDKGERSIVFKNNSKISKLYPEYLKPHFFYINVGDEIGRVEIPAWIAQDQKLVNTIAGVCLDQCEKGSGYPVCLAEAHEQAVVKGGDRDFFYRIVDQLSVKEKHKVVFSQKSLKKRRLGI